MQTYNVTELDTCDDPYLGAIVTRENGTPLTFSVGVMADPCPRIEWTFNGIHLKANENIAFNDPCMEVSEYPTWTFTLNVIITEATSGSYSAKLINIAGFTKLLKVYFTVPGMLVGIKFYYTSCFNLRVLYYYRECFNH